MFLNAQTLPKQVMGSSEIVVRGGLVVDFLLQLDLEVSMELEAIGC